jgi:putative transposase
MPRANRYFLPGYVWHITHRCHKREFLLKFARTRQRYLHWLYRARKRFSVEVLNYTITSNHVHLVVRNREGQNEIPAMIQLVAGRTAQEYNARKGRKGAFWEDRYHATAIEAGSHLQRCLTYVDLNMVRAGAVRHPEEWVHGGYHEIQSNRRRNTIIDLKALAEVLELGSREALRTAHQEWIAEALSDETQRQEDHWSQGLAVGSDAFVRQTQLALGHRGRYRNRLEGEGMSVLREAEEGYGAVFGHENERIVAESALLLEVSF